MSSTPDQSVDYFFNSPQRHTRSEGPSFTEGEAQFYKYMSSKTAPGQLYVYWNSETSSRPGLFSMRNASKGYATTLSKHMPLSELTVVEDGNPKFALSSRWFSHVSVVKIPSTALPNNMKESDMREVIDRLDAKLSGAYINYASERQELGRSIVSLGRSAKGSTAKDAVEWSAALHGHGHFAGLFKERISGIGGTDSYYLAVHSDSDILGEVLNGFAVANPTMTLGDFASSPQMDAVRSYSARNAHRILAEMAEALALDRKQLAFVQDIKAADPPNDYAPPELISKPYVDTVYNCFHDPIANGSTLVYYNTVSRLNASDQNSSRVAVLKNASDGLSILHLDPTKDYTVFRHSILTAGASESHTISHSNPHGAMPVGLGRMPGDEVTVLKTSKLSLEDANTLHRVYTWQGRSTRVSLSGPNDVISSLDRRLYIYKRPTKELKTLISFMVGDNTKVTNLKPVQVILPAQK